MINITSSVLILEPTHYVLQGITGNQMKTLGKITLPVFIDNLFYFDIKTVVVEKSSFPGDLLIGYKKIKDEDISLFPARGGAKFSFKFISFLENQERVKSTSNAEYR